jgi:hypothetical protein
MSFNGREGEQVSLNDASSWTANYRNSGSGSINAHFFGKDHITSILQQDGCMGIRVYYGINDEGNQCLILVGTDGSENDIEEGYIAERGTICPPYCGGGGSLQG